MTNYHFPPYTNSLDATSNESPEDKKERRRKQLEGVRARRKIIYERFRKTHQS